MENADEYFSFSGEGKERASSLSSFHQHPPFPLPDIASTANVTAQRVII
jgi:hypothetical protein